VAVYKTVRFRGIYPRIDLLYRIEDGALEYSFVLQPGADPRKIRMRIPEGWHVSITANVDLELDRAGEALSLRKLSAFQMIGPRRRSQRNEKLRFDANAKQKSR
jgi:hypothetical protein